MSVVNYLAAEELICRRLAVKVPELMAVVGARSAQEAQDGGIAMPFAMVIYAGDRIESGPQAALNYGAPHVVWQRWMVELVCNMSGFQSGSDERVEPGILMRKVLDALTGEMADEYPRWAPSDEHGELYRIQGPAPAYPTGKGVFPLMFETMVLTN